MNGGMEATPQTKMVDIIKYFLKQQKLANFWAVVVAQLVEWSLLIPVVRRSNKVIGNILYSTLTVNCIENTKIKKKRLGWPIFKKHH